MKNINIFILLLLCLTGSYAFAQNDTAVPSGAESALREVALGKIAPDVSPSTAAAGPLTKEAMPGLEAYRVGVDDVLDIDVIRPVPINTRMKVTSDGSITFPYIGIVHVNGLTLSQVQSDIQNELGKYMDYPVVLVSLWEAGSKKFTVYGEVFHPGTYPVEENMSLPDAITIAGGFAFTAVGGYIQSGPMGRVKLFRAKPQDNEDAVFESDINSILGSGKQDIIVRAGDTIVVSLDKFFITGQVNRPGGYPVEDHMSLLNAISTAGNSQADVQLKPNDVVVVSEGVF